MGTYQEVVDLLRGEYGWTDLEAPAPAPVELELQNSDADGVAIRLDDWCWSQAEKSAPPPGIEVWGDNPEYKYIRYSNFCEGVKYWELNTSIALGQQVEVPVDKQPEARTVSEWWNNQEHNLSRLGYKLIDENDPASVDDKNKRWAAAERVPAEWSSETDPDIYRLAVREGLIKVGQTGFHSLYSASTPASINDVRGLTAQKWLDNLRALDVGYGRDPKYPLPWAPTKPASKVPA